MSTQKIYDIEESILLLGDNAQSPNGLLTLTGLAAGAARISTIVDRGAGARARRFNWQAVHQFASAGVINEAVLWYIACSKDGTLISGTNGLVDAALSSVNKVLNLLGPLPVLTDTTSTNTDIASDGVIEIPTRYFSVICYNASTKNFRASTSTQSFWLTPFCKQVQAAV